MVAGIAKPAFRSFIRLLLASSLILITAFIPQSDTHASVAARSCACVDYVKNRFNLTGRMANGSGMGPVLVANGFVRVSTPRVGEVAVFQPRFGHGIWSVGHVAVIVQVQTWRWNKSYWLTTFRGANQGYTLHTEYGCNNISDMTILYLKSWGPTYIAYYTR